MDAKFFFSKPHLKIQLLNLKKKQCYLALNKSIKQVV